MKTKQVIVVRSDLHMKKGKLAAQVAHASLGAIMQLMSRKIFVDKHSNSVDRYSNNSYSVHYTLSLDEDSPVAHWFKNSFKKVVLVVNSEEEL
ncbi:MAG TPA: aminoacyl-tRNA hydrolase, partial [Patescibacteria group bacterium]|nr:aminoacyl-tRNA hydrolase [Patescibacteria group bacterium]